MTSKRTSLKNHKLLGFLCNTGPDLLKNRKAICVAGQVFIEHGLRIHFAVVVYNCIFDSSLSDCGALYLPDRTTLGQISCFYCGSVSSLYS